MVDLKIDEAFLDADLDLPTGDVGIVIFNSDFRNAKRTSGRAVREKIDQGRKPNTRVRRLEIAVSSKITSLEHFEDLISEAGSVVLALGRREHHGRVGCFAVERRVEVKSWTEDQRVVVTELALLGGERHRDPTGRGHSRQNAVRRARDRDRGARRGRWGTATRHQRGQNAKVGCQPAIADEKLEHQVHPGGRGTS